MAVSTIGLIVYFALMALSYFNIYNAPNVVMGLVSLVIAIALLVRR